MRSGWLYLLHDFGGFPFRFKHLSLPDIITHVTIQLLITSKTL